MTILVKLGLALLLSVGGTATADVPAERLHPPTYQPSPPPADNVTVVTNIVAGTQVQIDQGEFVLLNDPCWPGNDWSGIGCHPYIAAHRSTHGAPGAEVARLQVGDIVLIPAQDHIPRDLYYVVDEHLIVCCYHSDITAPPDDLILLTSADNRRVHLIRLHLVAEEAP